jgi:protein O-mannosyl-transferase
VTHANSAISPPPSPITRWLPLVCAILALLPFLPILGVGYVYDDVEVVAGDARLREPARILELWTQPFFLKGVDNLYRPLSSTTFALQWWLHGDQPWAFHTVNLLLHSIATALATLFTLRLFGWRAAAIAGVLFAVHPSRTEIIGIIAYRTEALVTVFSLAACIVALKPWTRSRIAAMLGLSLAALLSKEQAVVLPFILFLLRLATKATTQPTIPGEARCTKIAAVIVLWVLSAYLIARETLLPFMTDPAWIDRSINPIGHAHGLDRVLWPLKILGRYVQLLIAPGHLSIDHGGDNLLFHGWRDLHVHLGAVTLLFLACLAAYWLRRRQWLPLVCLFAAGATYFTISNAALVIGTHFGERLLYLPSAFLLPLIARHLASIRFGFALAVALAAGWLIVTIDYARHWTSPQAVYFHSMSHQPGSIRMPIVIAYHAQLRGEAYFGEVVLSAARKRLGHHWELWTVSAHGLSLLGQHTRAEQFLTHALNIAPDRFTLAVMSMSRTLQDRRDRYDTSAQDAATHGR